MLGILASVHLSPQNILHTNCVMLTSLVIQICVQLAILLEMNSVSTLCGMLLSVYQHWNMVPCTGTLSEILPSVVLTPRDSSGAWCCLYRYLPDDLVNE